MKGEQRYFHDPEFKMLVDFMVNAIIEKKYTPSEMRDAAMLASVKFEMTYSRSWMLPEPRDPSEKGGGA